MNKVYIFLFLLACTLQAQTIVNQWGFIGGRTGGWSINADDINNVLISGAQAPTGNLATIRGAFSSPVTASEENAIVVSGQMEFIGDGPRYWSGLRYGLFRHDSAGVIQNLNTDSMAWSGSEGHAFGYLFTPPSGNNNAVYWAVGDSGTHGVVTGQNWVSTWGGGVTRALDFYNQKPASAILGEGIYDWAISVQPQVSGPNEIRFYLIKDSETDPYIFSGISYDTSTVSTTFNGLCFGLLAPAINDTNNITGMRIIDISVSLGAPIDIPETDFSAPVVVSPLNDVTFTEDSGIHLISDDVRNVFSEADSGDIFSFDASSTPSISCWINNFVLTIKADSNFFGSGSVILTASNTWGLQTSDTILVTVTPTNDQPVVNDIIADQYLLVNDPFSLQFPLDLFSDPDGDILDYSASLANDDPLPNWLNFNPLQRLFSGSPAMNDTGLISVKLTASDDSSGSVSTQFNLEIKYMPTMGSYIDQWGFSGNRSGGWEMQKTFPGYVSISGDSSIQSWAAVRGGFNTLIPTIDSALIVSGEIEFNGSGFDSWSGIRYGVFYSDSAGEVQDDHWTGSETHHYGYLFTPRSGTNDQVIWTFDAEPASWGAVVDWNWLSVYGDSTYVLGNSNQWPENAVASEGIYDFAISIQPLGNGSTVVSFYLMKQDSSYVFSGSSVDNHVPLTTEKFNCFALGVIETNENLRKVNFRKMDAKLGGKIKIPSLTSPVLVEEHYPPLAMQEDSIVIIPKDQLQLIFSDPDQGDEYNYAVRTPDSKIDYSVSDYGVALIPESNYFGAGQIQLIAFNSYGSYAIDTIAYTIVPVNDAPQIVSLPDTVVFKNDSTLTFEMKKFGYDLDTPDSLLKWDIYSEDSFLVLTYDSSTTFLTITSAIYSGLAKIICVLTDDGNLAATDTVYLRIEEVTSINDDFTNVTPLKFRLLQNYPNPFNPVTKICFELPQATEMKINIYNVHGQLIENLFEGTQSAGYHQLEFNGINYASGIYLYKIESKHFTDVKKMILIK